MAENTGAAPAAPDPTERANERPGAELLPDGTEIDWKGDAIYAVEQMQAWREKAEHAAERANELERERDALRESVERGNTNLIRMTERAERAEALLVSGCGESRGGSV